jgi:hypothetical protein
VTDAAALGDGERERPVLPDEDLDAADTPLTFGEPQELGPSPG